MQDSAFDAGGLLRQWLGDFFATLRTLELPGNMGTSIYYDPVHSGSSKTVFMSRGSRYLPPAIYMDISRSVPMQVKYLEESPTEEVAFVKNLYITVGKVINTVLREEGTCLPESFASPLLIQYLLKGTSGILESRWMGYKDIEDAVLQFDPTYQGSLAHFEQTYACTEERRIQLCNFVDEYIYYPRSAFLELIKRGFDIVPLHEHLLCFSPAKLWSLFVGAESLTAAEVRQALVFDPCFDEDTIDEVKGAISDMSSEEIRQFLVFATGMPYINLNTSTITVSRSVFAQDQMSVWPAWPLPKSYTCFNQVCCYISI